MDVIRPIKKLLITPFEKFYYTEGKSGILLLLATVIALILANTALVEQYDHIRHIHFSVGFGDFIIDHSLLHWINDGLMTIFFFLIGLEMKREILVGELNSWKKASLPVFAAIGGMLMPAAIFLLLNQDPNLRNGWGIPMATDIAFSLAILSLLGNRIPLALKVFLTAFAIVDDLGAVLVVTFVYSGDVQIEYILPALGILAFLYFLSYRQVYWRYFVMICGLVVWYLFLESGVHPTLAGVLLAFAIPIRQRISVGKYNDKLLAVHQKILSAESRKEPILSGEELDQIEDVEHYTKKVQSPVQHLERKYHAFVAYFVMPVFALANAGIDLTQKVSINYTLSAQIAAALFFGGFLGVTLFSWISIKLKIASFLEGVDLKKFIGTAFLAGVGFTMSIFISNLAFADQMIDLESAKVGILAGSLISGLTGYLILRTTKA
ncbi:Na+/H+ antiporter NhaA [bacterium]|nr:Na+/H+ antiporter NhaA [bacterium]